jgi:hypothetical protein
MFTILLKTSPAGLVSLCIVAMMGCRGEPDQAQTNPVVSGGISSRGITGYVFLITSTQFRPADKSGVIVTVDGTTVSCETEHGGKYTLKGLAPGRYSITWRKPDFGFTRRTQVECREGELTPGPKIWVVQIPGFVVENLRDTLLNSTLQFTGRAIGVLAGYAAPIRFFVGTGPDVSSDPGHYRYSFAAYHPLPQSFVNKISTTGAAEEEFSLPLDRQGLADAGIPGGTVLYVVAYADAIPSQGYQDPSTGRTYFTTINPIPSNAIRLVLP